MPVMPPALSCETICDILQAGKMCILFAFAKSFLYVVTDVIKEADIRERYRRLTLLLIKRGLTITTMESATAGQIASLLTDTEGSSAILKGAFVTYSNEAKIQLGVPEQIIEKYTVYSVQTASAMAQVCRKAYQADIGVGVTGTMGNVDPANPESSVPGNVYYAISTGTKTLTFHTVLGPQPSRLLYKLAVADMVCEQLLNLLDGRSTDS